MSRESSEESAPSSSSVGECGVSSSSRETASLATDEERQIIIAAADKQVSSPTIRYATFVVKHPFFLFGTILVLVIICGCVSLIPQLGAPPLPDFSEPIAGFEARGTVISNRWRTQVNLIEDEMDGSITRVPQKCSKTKMPSMKQRTIEAKAVCTEKLTFTQGHLAMKLVFGTTNGQNLMTAKNLKSVCRLEQRIVRSLDNFDEHCHKDNRTQNCCPSWSLGNYIAALNNKPSCLVINEEEVKRTSSLLKRCSQYYHEGSLAADCWDFKKNKKATGKCQSVPKNCTRYNAVYNILHYLTDKEFLAPGSDPDLFLRHSLVLVPTNPDETFQVGVYKSRLRSKVSEGSVVLTGFELSELKFAIFNERLLGDLYLAAIAMFFIVTILWFYTRSMLITTLVGLIVVSALVIAYFIYTIILGMKFFPFLNVLTLVFLVGIGADDAFVYMDVWNQATKEHKEAQSNSEGNNKEVEHELLGATGGTTKPKPSKSGELENELISVSANTMKSELSDTTLLEHELISVTADTMKHASMSMFVTSFTTASAFLASLTSDITSIRLFGLYSGISILCTLFLMVTWFPAAVIIDQTVLSRYTCCSSCIEKLKVLLFKDSSTLRTLADRLIRLHWRFFNEFLPRKVVKMRFFWVVCLFGLAVCGIVVATAKPGLQLPSSQDFQMFHESHILEKYSLQLKKNFHFETSKRSRFPISLIWGIKPADNGNQFDPYDTGSLIWDENFDVSTREGQKWILKVISSLKKQRFFGKGQKHLSERCFVEEFFVKMNMTCTDENRPCCNESRFPYDSSVFSKCLLQMQCRRINELLYQSHSLTDEAPLFDANGTLRVISLKFESDIPFTWSYEPADKFWKQTENWASHAFTDAPPSANGWFISELKFYDLQKSLSKGTLFSMGLSLAMAFAVMLLTTRNIFISIFAIITIIGALGVTVGSLVLMGWKLNILESITLSVAVGLSIDFALHYGVAYVLATDKTDRQLRVQFSVSRMGSAITMAAFTTFITGAVIMPSLVLSYIQLGQFLMLIMSVSWVYATFFFQALCSILGPENDTGQLTLVKMKRVWRRLKGCCKGCESDRYQIVRRSDGSMAKKPVRVIYRK